MSQYQEAMIKNVYQSIPQQLYAPHKKRIMQRSDYFKNLYV